MLQAEYRELAEEYREAVRLHFGDRLVSVCFFGSAARCQASPESDLDALVIANALSRDVGYRFRETNPIHLTIRETDAYRQLRLKGWSACISDVFLTPEEAKSHPPILLDVADHGFVVYDSKGFLNGVLEEIRQRLRELGAKKVITKKGYYWILKPGAGPGEVIEV